MKYNIGIEDLAANALIAMLRQNAGNRFISYSKMNEYGLEVIKNLEKEGDKGIFIFSRDNVAALLYDYSDFFFEIEEDGLLGLRLINGKNLDDLITKFMAFLPLKLFYAFREANGIFTAA